MESDKINGGTSDGDVVNGGKGNGDAMNGGKVNGDATNGGMVNGDAVNSGSVDYDAILTRYMRLRAVSQGMNNDLMGAAASLAEQAARDLGLWHRGGIATDETEMPVLADHAIHHRFTAGPNVAERYAAEHPAEAGSDAATIQAAWGRLFFSIFRIDDTVRGKGLRVTDVLRGMEHFMADVNFSTTADRGMLMATRVLPFEGFLMATGAAQIVSWAEVLLRFATDGEEAAAKVLRKARKANRHVEKYFFPRKPRPNYRIGYYTPGDESEAISCAMLLTNAWKAHSPARKWLQRVCT